MKKLTNYQVGPRGVNTKAGTVWIDPGQTVEIDPADIIGEVPDLGKKPGDQGGNDSAEVEALRARIAELEAQLAGGKKPVGLTNKSKAELIEIAKVEGVEVADDAEVKDIKAAIELKREEAAKA